MEDPPDPGLIAFVGSRARALTLGVMANAEIPLSGYRIAKLANLPEIKVYQALSAATRAGLVERSALGFRLVDSDLRLYLSKKVRLRWSEEPSLQARRPPSVRASGATPSVGWFDPTKYRRNPKITSRYRREFLRPPEKDVPFSSGRQVGSRKRR